MVIISIIIVLYFSWALVLAYKYSTKYSYKTTENTFFIKIGTDLIQPVMEVFGNGKVTHFWHWQNFTPDYDYNEFGIKINKKTDRVFKEEFNLRAFLANAKADLNGVKEGIVVKPIDYNQEWSLAYCIEQETLFCQKSLLSYQGEIKILDDGSGYIWGLDKDDKPIKLVVLREININQETDILFV